MSGSETEPLWFSDGLAFSCTRCGACCTGAPGYVWVSIEEIERLAAFRKETVAEFSARFVRKVGRRFSLIERPGGDCIFWDSQAGCTVYNARPLQCRTWPFWPENVEAPEDWERTKRACPGSGRGRVYTADEILTSIGMVRE